MSDQIVNDVHPVEAGKYDSIIKKFMHDPNFNLLPLPDSIRKRFGIELTLPSLGIKEATAKALAVRNDYTGYEVRDQTACEIVFPPVPESVLPIEATVIVHQESEDHSNPPPSENASECSSDEHTEQPVSQDQSASEAK
jgi:hypothetical protein